MFSTVQRLNTLSNLWINALLVLCLWIAVSTYFDKKEAPSSVKLIAAERKTTRIYNSFYNIRQEYAFIRFELETGSFFRGKNISPLFHWNTKQVFVYVVASYASSEKYPYNEIMLWNRIISDKKDAIIRLRNQPNIFAFNDIEGSFANKNLTLSMYYNIMPQVGLLAWGNGQSSGSLPFSISH
ncbi:hypothetical protein PORY_000185 [Pneumocystis oryctolagi]|uniref:Uncharacterized protein n=1 Tax=Pneumocystis oryctolagi TaxID=42067 RepID=A0ACB7CEI5_9ASCO|nr:hypothetical protein PORY_000185 [Pneumocystis oryctolagi]